MSILLRTEGLGKSFTLHLQGGTRIPVLAGVDLAVQAGECVALSGPSGAGKSTLMRCLYGNYGAGVGRIVLMHRGAELDLASAEPRAVAVFFAGVIGVAAQQNTPIRINHATLEYAYIRTMREGLPGPLLDREIPLPGLAEPGSQLAVPLACAGQFLGVLFVESPLDMRFTWDDEDALVALSAQVAALLTALACAHPAGADAVEGRDRSAGVPEPRRAPPPPRRAPRAPPAPVSGGPARARARGGAPPPTDPP
jgi:energy-coupling factor transporter ATP-binding protein EcfA2